MGQSSSQLDQPSQQVPGTNAPASIDDQQQESQPMPIDTSAAEQLERDLLDVSQDGKGKEERKSGRKRRNRKKRKRMQELEESTQPQENEHAATNGAIATANTDQQESVAAPAHSTEEPRSPEQKSLDTATYSRKDMQRMLKRKELEDIVLSGRGHWRKLPDGKWGVKLHKEGEGSQRKSPSKEEVVAAATRKKEIDRLKYAEGIALESERKAREKLQKSTSTGKEHAEDEPEPTTNASRKRRRRRASVEEQQDEDSFDDRESLELVKEASLEQPHEQIYRLPKHVEGWLDDHATHGVAELTRNAKVTGDGASRKRKRISRFQDDDSDEYQEEQEGSLGPSDSYSVSEPPKKKPKRKSALSKSVTQDGAAARPRKRAPATSTGPLTAEEKATADRIFEETLTRCNLTKAELSAKIQNYREAGEFRTELEDALPDRSRDALRKFAQRRYHQCERGPWTSEQDAALRDAHAKWPGRWTEISKLVDRTADDCRDRWNKVLSKHTIGPWSTEEESALMKSVQGAIDKIKKEYRKDQALLNDQSRLEALVSWTRIAEDLGGQRSMKQCREKYHKLQTRKTRPDSAVGMQDGHTGHTAAVSGNSREDPDTTARTKMRDAIRHLNNFELGDYYDVFVEIHRTFPDHSVHFSSDDIIWSMVPWKNPGSRFSMAYYGGALRKAAFENAIRTWPNDSKKIRRKLEQAETVPAKALALANIIKKKVGAEKLDDLPRTYEPELVGKTSEEILQIKRERKTARRTKAADDQAKAQGLSKDMVSDSEAEDDAREEPAEQSADDAEDDVEDESADNAEKRTEAAEEEKVDVSADDAEGDSEEHADEHSEAAEKDPEDSQEDAQETDPVKREVSATPAAVSEHEREDPETDSASESCGEEESSASSSGRGITDIKQEEGQDESAEDDESMDDEVIPETQPETTRTPTVRAERSADTPKSSLKKNSKLSPEDFMQRCSDSSKRKKSAFTPINKRPITYSKKDRNGSCRI